MKKYAISRGIKLNLIIVLIVLLTVSLVLAAYLVQKPKDIKVGLGAAIPGDCDGVNGVDILDFQLLSNTFGKVPGDPGYDARCNFTGEPVIDILDYQILSNNFGRSVTSTITPTINPSVTTEPTPTQVPTDFLPAFPGVEGFGARSKGGRGGTIYKITNLNDSGTGSLRACVNASGPRYCIFDISGTIETNSAIPINNPYITIAGESAPSPGITIKGNGISSRTNDVIIRHLRIRVGDLTSQTGATERDGFELLHSTGYNNILDHLSISWAIDENTSTWYEGVHDLTISNSIVSESLNNSIHPEGPHSKGFLIGDYAKNVSLSNSLFMHNLDRNPYIKNATTSVIVNNLFYNFNWDKAWATKLGSGSGDSLMSSVVGNVYIEGNGSGGQDAIAIDGALPTGSKFYIKDNITENMDPLNDGGNSWALVSTPPVWPILISLRQASTVENYLKLNAGARPKDRDAVDLRLIQELTNRSGKIVDSQSQVGGWPNLAVNTRTFPIPTNPNGDDDNDGYTNLEELLHQYSKALEGF